MPSNTQFSKPLGGRKYTGEGIYKTLTDICMAAREKVCA